MSREDHDALCVLAFEALKKNGMAIARREIADLLDVDHINILVFGDMVRRGRELTEAQDMRRRAERAIQAARAGLVALGIDPDKEDSHAQ